MLALLHFNLGKRCLPSYKMLALLHFNLGKRCLPSYKMLALVQDARPRTRCSPYFRDRFVLQLCYRGGEQFLACGRIVFHTVMGRIGHGSQDKSASLDLRKFLVPLHVELVHFG